jgi:ABC-type nickel/cobalt efflux system permease component RcnA
LLKVTEKISPNGSLLALGLSMVAGLGVVSMIVALAVGVVQGSAADGNAIGTLFAAGLILFILGAGGWFAVVQPQKHFDDISKPMDTGHGHEEHHDEPAALPEGTHAEHH